jgi:hypothetical protein
MDWSQKPHVCKTHWETDAPGNGGRFHLLARCNMARSQHTQVTRKRSDYSLRGLEGMSQSKQLLTTLATCHNHQGVNSVQ